MPRVRRYKTKRVPKKRTLARKTYKARKKVKASRKQHAAYNAGYDSGYDKGYEKGRKEGYAQGKYECDAANKWKEGVESVIDRYIPDYEILPDISAEQVIAAGVEHLRPHFLHLLTPDELGPRILHALDHREPMSVVRLGDGELLTLAQGVVLSIEQVKSDGHFLGYAGVNVPDFEARDRLLASVREATVVGIPKLRVRNYQPLAFAVFRAYDIDYRNMTLTDSLINYYLYQAGWYSRLLEGRRVLIAGNLADSLAKWMKLHGVNVVHTVSPVHGVSDVDRVMGVVAGCDFDIALVPAGIAAVMIAQRIAAELGKVAIDFGHLANSMIKGEAPYK